MASKRINDLKSRVGDLERQLQEAKKRLHQAQLEEAGVSVGDVVVFKGEEFRVASVDPSPYGKAWVKGNPKKMNGTFGNAVRSLYADWEKLSSQP
jgi:hypothetical protein